MKYLRIKQERIRKYAELIGGLSIPLAILLFAYLQKAGAITILSYSWSPVCAGTEEDFCWATITFKANTDIYIYPSENNSWLFSTDKKLKLLRIERKWGDGWREIKLNESCNGRWCGCYWCDKNHKAKYSYVFRKGRTYVVRFVGYKYNPYSDVKWSFSDKIDPLWKGVNKGTLLSDTKKFYADILDDIGEHKVIINKTIPKVRMKKWEDETYIDIKINDTKYIPLGLVKDSKSPVIGKRLSEFSAKYKKTEKEIKIYSLNISREGRNVNGIEYEITLNEKPVSNKIKFEIDTKNLKFYYQPPLNEEKHEKDLTCNETDCWDENGTIHTHRPIDVVGSYAVYHESKSGDYSKMGGKNYMAGKAFHIYRPKIIDSKGNWVWGNLSIDEKKGILTIEIDQNFLDKAVYPVKIDPTFGYDTVGGSSATVHDNIRGSSFTMGDTDGVAEKLTAYSWDYSQDWALHYKGVIYEDHGTGSSPKICETEEKTNHDYEGWEDFSISGSPSLSASTDYALLLTGDYSVRRFTYDFGTSKGRYYNNNYPDCPDTVNFTIIDQKYSIYCTYTAGGGETTFSITLNSPLNQTTTDDSTPDFNFTVSGTESSYSCELFINDTGYGTATANNNTPTIITANQSLSDGTYDWYINCTAGGVTNQSEVREITIIWTTPSAVYTSKSWNADCSDSVSWYNENNAIDDNTGTYTYADDMGGTTCHDYIIFDLSSSKTIDQVRMYMDTDCSRKYNVYVTNDPTEGNWGSSLGTIGSDDCTGNINDWDTLDITNTNGQYIVFERYETSDHYAYINEVDYIEVTGGETTTFSITLNSPPNQTTTSDSTPDFNFTVSGTESSYSCELFINDIGYGTATANNNTATIITANQSLSDGTYDWYVNCSSGGVTNQSEVREITIDTNPPTFSNWQQNPPDLNSSSVGKLYINVTITDDSGVNDSSVKFYHWINDSQYPNQPWCFINGTARDFECEHNMTNITSSIFNITLHTYAYNPSTHNVHPETMSSATKYNYSLSSNNKALKVRFYNISTHPNTTYILKSKLYRNSGDLLVYYCNSSYTSGKVYNSDYCVAITTLTSQEDTTYQNTHFYGDENSYLDGVKITSTGYIVFYALTGSDWNVEYANIDSNSAETTNNGGTGWTNQDFTPDVWIIQLNGNGLTTFGYKVYACDTLGNCGNSSIQEDSYAIANLPPSPAPEIIVPENSTYSGIFNITWIASKDPNGDPFNYSLYLYYSNGTLADVLADNNITEGTEYFTFDSTQYPDGQYYLISNATDDAGNTNIYIMPYYFTIRQPSISINKRYFIYPIRSFVYC